ncbi:MAG: nucleoside monophosphate kinase, partial [Oscillospiraceae bacterium]|nr:nucleoside monophosphate kinase [Oscillospiraceae bacterium]
SQAEALDAMGVQIDVVLDIEVADEVIAGRLTGRRVCEGCGSSYHLQHKKPAVEGVCDRCGGKLIQRKDDAPETVADRLSVYHVQTEPLKDYYAGKGILKIVDVPETASVEETGRLVLTTLGVQA